jgi:hypothetical protein
MSRFFDFIQEARKKHEELRHSQSALASPVPPLGTKTELDTAREKEVCPMDGEYSKYPQLEMPQLRDGYKMCIGNASRLLNDAAMLKEAGRLRTACLIVFLAVEELGKAMQLYEAGRSGVRDWGEWWSRYFGHPKVQESTSPEIPGTEEAGERFARIREELVYVDFDKNNKRFVSPREDQDGELLELFEKEAADAESVLKALPSHAFERWEFEEMVRQSPEIAPSVLYARIEEILQQEPNVSETDLLTAIAGDLGMSPDDFVAGFERWKKVAPKARAYMDLLRRVQDRLKKEREAESTG